MRASTLIMKGTFFNKPLEWNIETQGESWTQGSIVSGHLKVKNHGVETLNWDAAGVGVGFADIKKIHAKTDGALKFDVQHPFEKNTIAAGETLDLPFTLTLPANCPVTDKKSSYYLAYGRNFTENHLQLKIEPKPLFAKIVGLMDTFYRFKLKEYKTVKNGVEYKLLPPSSRDMANMESLALTFMMNEDKLHLNFDFQVKKLETDGPTNKLSKANIKIKKELSPNEYSLGRDMINQDQLLKVIESVLAEVKLNNVF